MSEVKTGITRQFDRGASTYDRHAAVQKAMADRLMGRVAASGRDFRRILELGCGTGYLTAQLARAFPRASVVAVDLSARMVELALKRVPAPNVEFAVADAESQHWDAGSFDLVASSATIQWFETPGSTMDLLATALCRDGVMLHTCFGPETFRELRAVLAEIGGPSRNGTLVTSGHDWRDALRAAGLADVCCEDSIERRHYPDFPSFLRALKGTGAAFTAARAGGWEGYRTLKNAAARYVERFASPEGVPVTYQVLELSAVRLA